MNIYTGLLFQQGYIHDPQLALSLTGVADGDEAVADRTASAPNGATSAADPAACKPYHRGAVRDWCSVALSPFR